MPEIDATHHAGQFGFAHGPGSCDGPGSTGQPGSANGPGSTDPPISYEEFVRQCGAEGSFVERVYRETYGLGCPEEPKAVVQEAESLTPGRLRVADILREYGPACFEQYGANFCLAQRRALAELTACRTPALGSYSLNCEACGESFFGGYNSCRNRHCPSCGGPTRARWFERMQQDVLPVPYFHLVFTLPHDLSQLVLANRKPLYDLLFRATWATIRKLAADPKHLGGKTAATIVLHTWSQLLEHHPHVHAVVPGGGISPSGKWVTSRSPKFLFPYQVVSRIFRGKFLAGLKRLHAQGRLQLEGKLAHLADPQAFQKWLTPLYQKHDWVVHVQKAPGGCDGPDAVLKYLARYVTGTAISDNRLIAHEDGRVFFWAKDRQRSGKRVRRSLPGVEFTRRFLLHVSPRGFQRVRHYGWISNPRRKSELPRVREALAAADPPPAPAVDVPTTEPDSPSDRDRCPACGQGPMTKVESADTPSHWATIFLGSHYATPHDRAWHQTGKPAEPPSSAAAETSPSFRDTS